MEGTHDAMQAVTAHFSRDALPAEDSFGLYRKTALTRMTRVDGPFTVDTREGTLTCPDGWLAVDSAGWPYPIDATEHTAIYEPAEANR